MSEPGDYLSAEIDERERREVREVWLKPGRVAVPFAGVRLVVLKTNRGDAKVCVSLDRIEVVGVK